MNHIVSSVYDIVGGESIVIINGKRITSGKPITKLTVTVDGDSWDYKPNEGLSIEIKCDKVNSASTTSGNLTVHGDVQNGSTMSGDLIAKGDVNSAKTMSGNIKVEGDITGNCNTMSGNISAKGKRKKEHHHQ